MTGETIALPRRPLWQEFYELTKPKVVMLIAFTAVVGMFLAVPGMVPWQPLLFGTAGIWLAAASAAAINHVIDANIDADMGRTMNRPLPTGSLTTRAALLFALGIGLLSMVVLVTLVNTLTAVLTFFSLIGYAIVYTVWLKRATPQNIVIGGLAGAAPPLLGWTAVTGEVHAHALLLVLIIFVWTPPHFWALALFMKSDYGDAKVPMLTETHGRKSTRAHVWWYTVLLVPFSMALAFTSIGGPVYMVAAVILNLMFLRGAWSIWRRDEAVAEGDRYRVEKSVFRFSLLYLFLLFVALLADAALRAMGV